MNDYYVYLIHDLTGVPVYVGKGRGTRWRDSRRSDKIKALIKAGMTLPPVKVRERMTQAEAYELEKALIAFHGREDLGLGTLLNLCDGGAGTPNPAAHHRAAIRKANLGNTKMLGKRHSPASLAKMSEAQRGNTNARGKKYPPRSPEWRAKLSESLQGRKAPNAGKPMHPNNRAAIIAANTGKKHTVETREKMRLAQLGKKRGARSAETLARMALAQTGKKRSPESIAKQFATRAANRLAKLAATMTTEGLCI